MDNFGALLLQNGIYAGVALLVIVFGTVLFTSVLSRIGSAFLGIKPFAGAAVVKAAISRWLWRFAFLVILASALLLTAGLVVATRRGLQLSELLQSALAKVQTKDWLALGVAAGKALGALLLAFIVARLVVKTLHYLRERLQAAEALVGHRERISAILERLRVTLTTALFFGTLLFCAEILGLPSLAHGILRAISYVAIALFLGRFLVGTAQLAIDVVFDLSEALGKLESPVRYISRLRHLSKLTKTTADYFISVGIATWTIEQLTPGTWAAQAGRQALRIIAIFYLSRVVVEVCVLFMNEFFLSGDDKSPAELQQRQTLVPVAASILRYGIYFSAVIMSLKEAGLDPTPLIAGAGVAGVAIGLGAQSFMGDLVAGFFILFENLYLVGDFIEVGEIKGKVEEIGVRVTKIRDEAGVLHVLPNGEMRKISSHSRGYVNAVVDLLVPYGENLHRVFEVLRKKTSEVRERHDDIMGTTELAVEEMTESAIKLRTVTMVKPGAAKDIEDVLKLAFWDALVTARISPPYSRQLRLAATANADELPTEEQRRLADVAPRTDIQKLKAYNLYLAMDLDDNGYLEQADVEALGQRLLSGQKREADTAVADELRRHLETYWKQLIRLVDYDEDGRVSREEFLQFCAAVSRDFSGPAGESVKALSDVLFTVCDRNGNEALSEGEFVQWARAYGFAESAAITGFNLIDRDRNGRITKDEWQRFLRDVFLSRQLNDAAAVVFGPGSRSRS